MKEEEYYDQEDIDGMMEADEPDYYHCSCCNHTQAERGWGGSCDHCGLFGTIEEAYF